jgi:hypothetical protein
MKPTLLVILLLLLVASVVATAPVALADSVYDINATTIGCGVPDDPYCFSMGITGS